MRILENLTLKKEAKGYSTGMSFADITKLLFNPAEDAIVVINSQKYRITSLYGQQAILGYAELNNKTHLVLCEIIKGQKIVRLIPENNRTFNQCDTVICGASSQTYALTSKNKGLRKLLDLIYGSKTKALAQSW